MLGRLRLGPQNLRGRRFPEPSHPYRNDFQRDRDRIIHSRAFRRLEGKTQVFSLDQGDHFRNRLTHTIEVAQIARTVAGALDLNDEYTETLALAHDLGHPPFGHAGEQELDRQMRRFNACFEHNRHGLRIVDALEARYVRFPGLNLTFEVREGILKHSRELLEHDCEGLQDLMPGVRPPLEAQLLDYADEVAYCTADLDDAFDADMLTTEQIGEAVPLFGGLAEQVDTQFPGAAGHVRFWEIQRRLMNVLINGLIEGTVEKASAARVETVQDVRVLDHRLAGLMPEPGKVLVELKSFLVRHVYSYPELEEVRSVAVAQIGELFQFLLEHPEHLSPGYRECLENSPPHRVTCDYIAGMTDSYFLRTYKALLG